EPPRPTESAEFSDHYAGFAAPGSLVAKGLDAIVAADKNFDVKQFIAGARAAYEMIVTAYAVGERRSLKNLLAREVYDGFENVIREREARGETVETRFISIDAPELTSAELRGKMAQLTLRFVSQLVSATRNRSGHVIDGSADVVTNVTDVWTFAREVTSRDPNWNRVATEGGPCSAARAMCTLLFRLVLSSAIVASTAVASTGVADARQGLVPPSDQVAAAGRAAQGH